MVAALLRSVIALKEGRTRMNNPRIAVIGAGTMGNGVAQVCAQAGLAVTMVDVNDAAVQRGVDTVGKSLGRLVSKEKMTAGERTAVLGRIQGTTDYAAIAPADIVIEAATENLDLKLRILRQIDGLVRKEA